MGFGNFLIYYVVREWRENKRRRRSAVKRKRLRSVETIDIECNQSVGQDTDDSITNYEEDNVPIHKRSFISRLILIWGVLEILLLLYVLIMKKETDYPDNFLYGLCQRRALTCRPIINRIIYYKILTSVFLVLGAHNEMVTLMIPWLFVNVLGIFPFWLVTISAFRNFTVEKENMEGLIYFLHRIFY